MRSVGSFVGGLAAIALVSPAHAERRGFTAAIDYGPAITHGSHAAAVTGFYLPSVQAGAFVTRDLAINARFQTTRGVFELEYDESVTRTASAMLSAQYWFSRVVFASLGVGPRYFEVVNEGRKFAKDSWGLGVGTRVGFDFVPIGPGALQLAGEVVVGEHFAAFPGRSMTYALQVAWQLE